MASLNWIDQFKISRSFSDSVQMRLLCSRVTVFSKYFLFPVKLYLQCSAFSFLRKWLILYARKELEFLKEKLQNSFYRNQLWILIKEIMDKILHILRYTDLLMNLRDFVQISCSVFLTYSFFDPFGWRPDRKKIDSKHLAYMAFISKWFVFFNDRNDINNKKIWYLY